MRSIGTWLGTRLSSLFQRLRGNGWNSIQKQPGCSIVVIKTTTGYYLECMKNKEGEIVGFEQAKEFSGPYLDIDKMIGWKAIE